MILILFAYKTTHLFTAVYLEFDQVYLNAFETAQLGADAITISQ